VHVFALALPDQLTALDLAVNLLQALHQSVDLALAQYAGAPQPAGVRYGAGDVFAPQLRVHVHTGVQPLHSGVDLLG
jgi:hypothetical protein